MDRIDAMQIHLEPGMRALMEARGITEEDIRRVLTCAKEEGRFHGRKVAEHRLDCFTPAKVTYWVEYGLKEDGYEIRCIYSHRMKKADVNERTMEGVVLVPHGWEGEANCNRLTDAQCREPIMGYPQWKGLLCNIRKVE